MSELNDDLMGIGEVARLVGLDADTLRFYERRGILPSPGRDVGGRRQYAPAQVEAIQRLVALKSTGMSLADITQFAAVADDGMDAAQLAALQRHEAELRDQRRRIDASLQFLEHKLDAAGTAASGRVRYLTRPDAEIAWSMTGSGPLLFLVGAPAGRAGFSALAAVLSDRFTVVTHDPRGIGDSTAPTATAPIPQVLAEDLIALVTHVAQGPVAMFGTSGGGVTVMELLAQAPHLVARAIVHEPPLARLLDDPDLERDAAMIFERAGLDPQTAFEQWLDLTGAGQSTGPGETPVASGALPPLPEAELDKNRYFLGRMAGPTVFYEPDMDALTDHAPTIYAGRQSHGQLARRTSEALATRLGATVRDMPGNHLAASTHPDHVAEELAQALLP